PVVSEDVASMTATRIDARPCLVVLMSTPWLRFCPVASEVAEASELDLRFCCLFG
ncbi:hypothetical protein A2U01_0099581, partial [Trifolium medium]|nr:hypothetical protein [Trifolium medium]